MNEITLNVSLFPQDWNIILSLLAEHPYKMTAPLIKQIVEQTRAQTKPHPMEEAPIRIVNE